MAPRYITWHGIFYIINVALFELIKKAFYTRGIWEALGHMLWHGYTTGPTVTRLVQDPQAVVNLDNHIGC